MSMRLSDDRELTADQKELIGKRISRVARAQEELRAAVADYEDILLAITGDKAFGVDVKRGMIVRKPDA